MEISREAVRSAVVLAKIRYQEQLHPFVHTSKDRLESTLIQDELDRIVTECSEEVGADPVRVRARLDQILAEVVLPVTEPEHQEVTDLSDNPGAQQKKDEKDYEPQATTDVMDTDAVLEDEILEPDKRIPVQGCFRCGDHPAMKNSSVCPACSFDLVTAAFEKEALGPQMNAPSIYQPGLAPSNPAASPLNPNAPYQCTVCGFTGNFQDVQNHLATSNDSNHMRAKQTQGQPQQNAQYGQGQQQQQVAAKLEWKLADDTTPAYEETVHKDEVKDTNTQTTPAGHFNDIVSSMANRAAARHFSTPQDDKIQAIADTYGLDSNEVKQNLYITAKFGDFAATNGQIGEDSTAPDGYVPLSLEGLGGKIEKHEAVVPTNVALAKTAEDLGVDSKDVYADVKDNFGDDLADEYHTSVQGEYHYFLAQAVIDKATKSPDPQTPDGQQQAPAQPQQQQQQMPAQQQSGPMPQFASAYKLNQPQLEVLLTRDHALAMQRQR